MSETSNCSFAQVYVIVDAKAYLEFIKSFVTTPSSDEEAISEQLSIVINSKSNGKNTVLQSAELFKSLTEIILKKTPSLTNKQDSNGCTMLHYASSMGYTTVVALLLQKGASTAIEDIYGQPPLAYAERYAREDIVNLLLEPQGNLLFSQI